MRRAAIVLLSSLLLCGTVQGSEPAYAEKLLEGYVCSQRVHELTNDIDWYKSLKKAEDAARQEGKLIFWVHMLGKIDGAT